MTACASTSRASPSAMYSVTARFVYRSSPVSPRVVLRSLVSLSAILHLAPLKMVVAHTRYFAISIGRRTAAARGGCEDVGLPRRARNSKRDSRSDTRSCLQDRLNFDFGCSSVDETIRAAPEVQLKTILSVRGLLGCSRWCFSFWNRNGYIIER